MDDRVGNVPFSLKLLKPDDHRQSFRASLCSPDGVEEGGYTHMAFAFLSNGTSFPLRWRLMTSFAPPTNSSPMYTAGTLGLCPNAVSARSSCCPLGSSSSS
nr:hypothetical protein Iba_chr07fCG0560 [Ipomoea batatas]